MNLKNTIRSIQGWPIEGVVFRDITTLMQDPEAYMQACDVLHDRYKDMNVDKIVGIDAGGFVFGAVLSYQLGIGFVPVRKPGKLPRATYAQDYQLEYGQDTLEIHQDALVQDDSVLIIDDLLATGGTIEATTKLIRRVGAHVQDAAFVISLPDLGGEVKLEQMCLSVFSLLQYDGD